MKPGRVGRELIVALAVGVAAAGNRPSRALSQAELLGRRHPAQSLGGEPVTLAVAGVRRCVPGQCPAHMASPAMRTSALRVLVIGQGSMGRRRVRNLLHIGGSRGRSVRARRGAAPAGRSREPHPGVRGLRRRAGMGTGRARHLHAARRPSRVCAGGGPTRVFTSSPRRASCRARRRSSSTPSRGQAIVAAPSCTLRFHPGDPDNAPRIADGGDRPAPRRHPPRRPASRRTGIRGRTTGPSTSPGERPARRGRSCPSS